MPRPQPQRGGTCPTRNPEKEHACGRRRYERITAERIARGMCPRCGKAKPRPIGPCAGTAAKSGAMPSAQDAPGPRRLANNTAAETRNGAASLRATGAGGATGRGRTRAQYAARRIAGLCGRCGTPAPSDAAYCDRCARSAAKRSRKKAKNARSRQRYVQRRVRRLCIDCAAPSQGASRCPPCARRSWARSGEHRGLPVLPPRVTVIEIATGKNHGYLEQDLIPSEVPQQADFCGF